MIQEKDDNAFDVAVQRRFGDINELMIHFGYGVERIC